MPVDPGHIRPADYPANIGEHCSYGDSERVGQGCGGEAVIIGLFTIWFALLVVLFLAGIYADQTQREDIISAITCIVGLFFLVAGVVWLVYSGWHDNHINRKHVADLEHIRRQL
jgi:predicted transporter